MASFSSFVYAVRSATRRAEARTRLERARRSRRRQFLADAAYVAGGLAAIGALVAIGRWARTLEASAPRTPPRSRSRLEDTVRVLPLPPPPPRSLKRRAPAIA